MIYPWSSFSPSNPKVNQVINTFINTMEHYFKVERHGVDLDDQCTKGDPSGSGQPLAKHVGNVIVGSLYGRRVPY